jgi:hypothetical protein
MNATTFMFLSEAAQTASKPVRTTAADRTAVALGNVRPLAGRSMP